jgi:hypothetical protein
MESLLQSVQDEAGMRRPAHPRAPRSWTST